MNIKFLRSLGIIGSVVALPFTAAEAQVYDTPGGSVVQAAISSSSSAASAALVASGTSGAIGAALGGISTSSSGSANSFAQGPATRFFEGGNRGSSAGAKEKKMGVWILGAYSDIENDNVNTAFDGDIVNVVGGVDYRFTNKIIGGVAVSFEKTDLDTTFNLGTFEQDGVGVMPYVAFILNKNISADLNVGYTDLDIDTTRTSAGAISTASYSGDRTTAGANLNFNKAVKKWSLGASVGFLYIKEETDAFTESNGTAVAANEISIGQGRASGRLGYNMGKVQPYVNVRYENEFWAPSDATINGTLVETDTSGFVITGGLDFTLSDKVSGGVAFSSYQERDDLDLYSISGRVRVAF
ncbi:MAG: autotransporter outer membrane beta-barrel domain-containing protein [Rhodospirillaceae bacterium]|nr:autotransporter outer membrane beta-barrel domain-containing protein [Rhodospirillaceae bacterium]MBT5667013.1 autotransporter outer membrane beta-barrel domain-containing protein [Rhodospirillaceae bacterium]MBT5812363.1 autotransporter outer membrane beta-barrel domain-containing protein [Rhodospirillaceae bacterium]